MSNEQQRKNEVTDKKVANWQKFQLNSHMQFSIQLDLSINYSTRIPAEKNRWNDLLTNQRRSWKRQGCEEIPEVYWRIKTRPRPRRENFSGSWTIGLQAATRHWDMIAGYHDSPPIYSWFLHFYPPSLSLSLCHSRDSSSAVANIQYLECLQSFYNFVSFLLRRIKISNGCSLFLFWARDPPMIVTFLRIFRLCIHVYVWMKSPSIATSKSLPPPQRSRSHPRLASSSLFSCCLVLIHPDTLFLPIPRTRALFSLPLLIPPYPLSHRLILAPLFGPQQPPV